MRTQERVQDAINGHCPSKLLYTAPFGAVLLSGVCIVERKMRIYKTEPAARVGPLGRVDDRNLCFPDFEINHDPIICLIRFLNEIERIGDGHQRIGTIFQPGDIDGLAG